MTGGWRVGREDALSGRSMSEEKNRTFAGPFE